MSDSELQQERPAGVVSGDCHDGEGEYCYGGNSTYSGQWVNAQREGDGRYIFAHGGSYDGQWRANLIHGFGVYTFPSGNTYEGQFREDVREGVGVYTYSGDGISWEGQWRAMEPMTGSAATAVPVVATAGSAVEEARENEGGEQTHENEKSGAVRDSRLGTWRFPNGLELRGAGPSRNERVGNTAPQAVKAAAAAAVAAAVRTAEAEAQREAELRRTMTWRLHALITEHPLVLSALLVALGAVLYRLL